MASIRAKIKELMCPTCGLNGHCAEGVECNPITEIKKIIRRKKSKKSG